MQMQPTSNIDSVQVTRQRSLWSWARSYTYGACYHTLARTHYGVCVAKGPAFDKLLCSLTFLAVP